MATQLNWETIKNGLENVFGEGSADPTNLGKILMNYFIKGSLLTGVSNLYLLNARQKAEVGFKAALVETLFFAAILVAIDYIVPRFLPFLSTGAKEVKTDVVDVVGKIKDEITGENFKSHVNHSAYF